VNVPLAQRAAWLAGITLVAAIAALAQVGVSAVPVARVHELMEDGDFLADILGVATDPNGGFWPILKVPYRLSHTPARVRAVPGAPAARYRVDQT